MMLNRIIGVFLRKVNHFGSQIYQPRNYASCALSFGFSLSKINTQTFASLSQRYQSQVKFFQKLSTEEYNLLNDKLLSLNEQTVPQIIKWMGQNQQNIEGQVLKATINTLLSLAGKGKISPKFFQYESYKSICEKDTFLKCFSLLMQTRIFIRKQIDFLNSQKSQHGTDPTQIELLSKNFTEKMKKVSSNLHICQYLLPTIDQDEKFQILWHIQNILIISINLSQKSQKMLLQKYQLLLKCMQISQLYWNNSMKNWYELEQYFKQNPPTSQFQRGNKEQFIKSFLSKMFLFIGLRTQYVRSLGHLFDALPTLLDTLESKARIINIILNEINKTEQSYDQFQDIAPSMFRIDQHYCEMKFLQFSLLIILESDKINVAGGSAQSQKSCINELVKHAERITTKLDNYLLLVLNDWQRLQQTHYIVIAIFRVLRDLFLMSKFDENSILTMLQDEAKKILGQCENKTKQEDLSVMLVTQIENCLKERRKVVDKLQKNIQ